MKYFKKKPRNLITSYSHVKLIVLKKYQKLYEEDFFSYAFKVEITAEITLFT